MLLGAAITTAIAASRPSSSSLGLRIRETRELVGRPRVVTSTGGDKVLGRRVAQALELVPGAAEPTCAALNGGGTGYASVVEALQLRLSAAEPT